MSRMRGYQTRVQQGVYQAWAAGNKVVMGVLPTGAGKTILMANTIRQHAGCSLMMAHRGQLVGQISQALARESVVHNIIGPSPLIKTIVDAHMDEFGKTFFNASAKCSVASVDTLARRNVGSFAQQVTLGMMDECFPAGTLVDGVPIETLSIGDEVVAFDDATGEFSKRKIVRTFKNPIPASLVVICTARATLKCTGGHPFWTQRGWVNAIYLTTDDKVLEYGHEEGQFSRWVRLESVSIQKPTSADGAFVYNVEVAGLNTYVANGIVTHNCHHTLADNKWGRCVEMFPNAKWLMVTATPKRADGRGLGRHASGLIDTMCIGPTMRELIDWGFLTDYTVRWVQPSDLDLEGIRMSNATGDYNQDEVTARVKHSGMIIGNIVDTYCKHTMGKLAVCFSVDIEHANDIAKRFNERNVAAEVISADTPEAERRAMLKRFKNRQTLILLNVDLFGEGFDLPAIEVVIFGRPTASLALFIQQFGRVLRLMISPIHMAAWDTYTVEQRKRIIAESGKPFGMVHDHVGNIAHFGGAPDMFTDWTLEDAPEKASKSAADAIPLRPCLNCQMPYMRMYPACPFCGWEPPLPEARGIKEVDGDLSLLTSDQLRELLGAKQAFYSDPKIPYGASFQVEAGIRNMHANKMHNQTMLQDVMKLVMPPLYDERTNNRKFYLQYGIDTLTAQTLPSADATKLRERILESLRK